MNNTIPSFGANRPPPPIPNPLLTPEAKGRVAELIEKRELVAGYLAVRR